MIRSLTILKNIFIIPEVKTAYTPIAIKKKLYKINRIPNNFIK